MGALLLPSSRLEGDQSRSTTSSCSRAELFPKLDCKLARLGSGCNNGATQSPAMTLGTWRSIGAWVCSLRQPDTATREWLLSVVYVSTRSHSISCAIDRRRMCRSHVDGH